MTRAITGSLNHSSSEESQSILSFGFPSFLSPKGRSSGDRKVQLVFAESEDADVEDTSHSQARELAEAPPESGTFGHTAGEDRFGCTGETSSSKPDLRDTASAPPGSSPRLGEVRGCDSEPPELGSGILESSSLELEEAPKRTGGEKTKCPRASVMTGGGRGSEHCSRRGSVLTARSLAVPY